jgi:uncharacterized protein YaiI (UPF0178 family)
MKIWVDADACPRDVKDVIYKVAERKQLHVVLVSNGNLTLPRSPLLSSVRVAQGLDVADGYIVQHAQSGDLAVTQDVPLAAELVPRGVTVLDPRGELYDADSVKERLAMRDLMKELRDSGVVTGGPKSWDARDKQQFANALDRVLARFKR